MSNEKKYYWLKLKDNFFKDKEIKKLRKIAGGDTYTIIYLKMQLLSLKNCGKLFFDKLEDTFADELALDLDEEVENVKITLLYLQRCGLLEDCNNDEYLLPQTIESIGKESDSARRVRRYREQKVLQCNALPLQCNALPLQCNGDVTKCNTEIDIDIDIEKEKELNINIENKQSSKYINLRKDQKYTDDFEQAWALYPQRDGSNAKQAAYKCWKARVKEGVSSNDLILATKNYQVYCESGGIISTNYVMQARRFYGESREYETFINYKKKEGANERGYVKKSKLTRANEQLDIIIKNAISSDI